MLHVREQRVNADKSQIFYDEGFDCDESSILENASIGDIYRYAQGENGRCTSKMYRDCDEGPPEVVGWVFVKREKYDNVDETFLCETWVTVYDRSECESCKRTQLTVHIII